MLVASSLWCDRAAPFSSAGCSFCPNADGAEVAHSVDDALALAGGEPVSIIGGAEIFALFLPIADRLELTEIAEDVTGDTVMPDPRNSTDWRETGREGHPAEGGAPGFVFVSLERD